ncbi:MAG: glycosyltransferase family 39 protein, partial [Dehalococcoidia bacterium]|nr:glycosyltransferase family 39 protein [Dehalococcoidia bacterium]
MSSRIERIVACFLILAAFNLRIFRLDLQSIWSDEGLSIYRASHDLADIPGLSVAGIHPPLYDSLLHFWILLAGSREFSTRFLSLFFGVLALALIFQLGRSLLGRGGAVLATLVAVAAPFLVYYSQETRMYAPALFFTLLSVVAFLRWLRPAGSPAWLACYVVATAAAAYTHYYAWLIVAFLNLFFLLWVWVSGRGGLGRLMPWITAHVVLVLVYLPWIGVLINKYETYLTPAPGSSLANILYQSMVSFGLGYSGGQAGATPGQVDLFPDHWIVLSLAVAMLVVAVWGMLSGSFSGPWRQRSFKQAFLPLYLVVPVIALIFLSWGKRDFAPRYLIFAAPAYYLLIGQGLAHLFSSWKPARVTLGALALLLVLGASAMSLRNYYYDPTYWRDDMRGMAEFINSQARDGDAIILNANYLRPTFGYYYRGAVPVVGLPDSMPVNWEEDLASLQDLASHHDRVWLVLWQT